jgi:tripartite-type tricarboxylate transporter receptor subunit TctC
MSKGWYGLLAPAKTPRPVFERLAREGEKIARSADTAAKFAEWGLEPAGMTLEKFAEQIRTERALNRKIIDEIGGITLD